MSIRSTELKMYQSKVVSGTPSNGGLMSTIEVVSGVSANLFPNASLEDRTNGADQFRKLFFKVANSEGLALIKPRVWQDTNTVGGDRVIFFPASQRSTENDITGYEPKYGMGYLFVGALEGDSTIQVEVEYGPMIIFRKDGLIRISNKETPNAAGNEVWVRVSADPVINGNVVTLTLVNPLSVTFLSGAKVSSVYEMADIQSSLVGVAKTSAAGGVDTSVAGNAKAHNIGSVEQNWTLTFQSPTGFEISGDTLGIVGSGNTLTTTAPISPGFASSYPYFTLLPALFTGVFAVGDVVTFTTHPAASAVWLRRTIPAGTTAVGSNSVALYIDGETQ